MLPKMEKMKKLRMLQEIFQIFVKHSSPKLAGADAPPYNECAGFGYRAFRTNKS